MRQASTSGERWRLAGVGGALRRRAVAAGLASVLLLTDLPLGIVVFVVTLIGLSLSVGLAPLFLLGAVVFWGSGFVTRAFARFERARLRLFVGMELPTPPRPRTWRAEFTDGATWRARGYLLLRLPVGIVTFTLMLLAWAVPLTLITLPFYNDRLPAGGTNIGFATLSGPAWSAAAALIGLVLLAVAPSIVIGLARWDAAMARALLAGQSAAAMTARLGELESSRAQVVDAADTERRRIERDLHDGAQQRLVALAMNLDRARRRFDTDPDDARAIIDDAHTEAKTALAELRDLTRGIHPAVLTDRGLDAALSGLAARCPIPVRVDVDLDGRFPPTIEAVAYFVASEALTNIAKHSRARSAAVTVRSDRDVLRLSVVDDGVGGADPARGTGLAGLAGRVAGADGHLTLTSPVGGPTTITVELPCAS